MSSNNLQQDDTLIDKHVMLHSLNNVASNGRKGVVLRPTAADNPERVQVLLAESKAGRGDSKTISVKPTNLVIIDPMSDMVAALAKFVTIMGQRPAFPDRTRNKILELLGEQHYQLIVNIISNFMRRFRINANNLTQDQILFLIQTWRNEEFVLISNEAVVAFLHDLGEDIYDMITDRSDHFSIDYRGLDINRDTVAEIETALRHYPGLLPRRTTTKWDVGEDGEVGWLEVDEREGDLPIQCLISYGCQYESGLNVKAIPFIARFARLAIEFGSFQVHEKGGLLIQNNDEYEYCDILLYLVKCRGINCEEGDVELIESVCLAQLTKLRAMGIIQGFVFPNRTHW